MSLGSQGSCMVGGNLSTNAGGTQVLTPRFQIVASPKVNNLAVPNEDARAIELEDSNLFALNRFVSPSMLMYLGVAALLPLLPLVLLKHPIGELLTKFVNGVAGL